MARSSAALLHNQAAVRAKPSYPAHEVGVDGSDEQWQQKAFEWLFAVGKRKGASADPSGTPRDESLSATEV